MPISDKAKAAGAVVIVSAALAAAVLSALREDGEPLQPGDQAAHLAADAGESACGAGFAIITVADGIRTCVGLPPLLATDAGDVLTELPERSGVDARRLPLVLAADAGDDACELSVIHMADGTKACLGSLMPDAGRPAVALALSTERAKAAPARREAPDAGEDVCDDAGYVLHLPDGRRACLRFAR